jgi:hypothetical protein
MGINITFALGCLAIPSIFVGLYKRYDCWYRYSVFWYIFVNMQNVNIFDAEFVSLFYKTLPVNLSFFFLRLFCTISDLIYCF